MAHGDFLNDQIFIENLPQVEEIDFQKLQSSYIYILLFRTLVIGFLIFIAYTFFIIISGNWSYPFLVYGYGIVFLYGIVSIILRYLGFHKKAYALRREDIVYKTGLLWKSETVVPFSRIQHCEIKEGPVESMLDLVHLKVYTAGGSGGDLVIPGLEEEKASRLRNYIIRKTRLDEEE